jgi:RHS repeat-associated protein
MSVLFRFQEQVLRGHQALLSGKYRKSVGHYESARQTWHGWLLQSGVVTSPVNEKVGVSLNTAITGVKRLLEALPDEDEEDPESPVLPGGRSWRSKNLGVRGFKYTELTSAARSELSTELATKKVRLLPKEFRRAISRQVLEKTRTELSTADANLTQGLSAAVGDVLVRDFDAEDRQRVVRNLGATSVSTLGTSGLGLLDQAPVQDALHVAGVKAIVAGSFWSSATATQKLESTAMAKYPSWLASESPFTRFVVLPALEGQSVAQVLRLRGLDTDFQTDWTDQFLKDRVKSPNTEDRLPPRAVWEVPAVFALWIPVLYGKLLPQGLAMAHAKLGLSHVSGPEPVYQSFDEQPVFVDMGGNTRVRYRRHADRRTVGFVTKGGGITTCSIYLGSWEYHKRVGGTPYTKTSLHLEGRFRYAHVERVLSGTDADSLPVLYTHVDHLGSAQVLTQSGGTLLCQEEFFAYGRSSDRRDGKSRYRYIGVERDENTGLSITGPRTYDPIQGRFMQGDPAAEMSVANCPYEYAHSCPSWRTDASGLQDELAPAGGTLPEASAPPSLTLDSDFSTPRSGQRQEFLMPDAIRVGAKEAIEAQRAAHLQTTFKRLQEEGNPITFEGWAPLVRGPGNTLRREGKAVGMATQFTSTPEGNFESMSTMEALIQSFGSRELSEEAVVNSAVVEHGFTGAIHTHSALRPKPSKPDMSSSMNLAEDYTGVYTTVVAAPRIFGKGLQTRVVVAQSQSDGVTQVTVLRGNTRKAVLRVTHVMTPEQAVAWGSAGE